MSGLDNLFHSHVLVEPSDIIEHLPYFVQTVHELNATKVIELGVREGISTIAWLYALKDKGNLWSCDVSFPTPPELLNPQGTLGVQPHFVFLLGDCHGQQIYDALPDEVDIVFVDTNHVFEETLLELEMYYPKVRKGGRILMHDTAIEDTANRGDRPKTPYPVRTAAEMFCEKYNLRFENRENCNGLGTIYC